MFSNFGGKKAAAPAAKASPPKDAAAKQLDADRAEATRLVTECRTKIKKPMENMHNIADSQYWKYGYMGSTLLSAGALTFLISSRFPAFASVGSMASLGAGFIGGPKLHEVHVMALKMKVVKELDDTIEVLEAQDSKHGSQVPLYYEELQTIRKTRYDLLPAGMSITGQPIEGAEGGKQRGGDIDSRVDDFLVAYQRKRGSLPADSKP